MMPGAFKTKIYIFCLIEAVAMTIGLKSKSTGDLILIGILIIIFPGLVGCNYDTTLGAKALSVDGAIIADPMDASLNVDGVSTVPVTSSAAVDVYALNERDSPERRMLDTLPIAKKDDLEKFADNKHAFDCLIEPSEISEVATSISGVLEEVAVGRGDRVQKNQIIAKLRLNVEKANVDLARAEVKFRERNYRRWEEMHEQNYASNVEKDQAETQLEIARYELERAEQILNERIIRSPFDGVVVEQYLSAGELSEDRKIFKLAKIDVLYVEVIAPVNMLGKVRKGMRAKVYPEGPVTGPFWASVTVVDPIIDAASGTLGMRFELPNTDYRIPAGVRCNVDFQDMDLSNE